MPNEKLFPITGLAFNVGNGCQLNLTPEELEVALQYSPTPGLPKLVALLMNMQLEEHNPPSCARSNMKVAISTGSQDALAKAFNMLLNADDSLLLENPTYSGSLAFLKPLGCHLAGINTDGDGLDPVHMEHILKNWEMVHPGRRFPRVLYTIPTGANPSGGTLTLSRKQAIYRLAQKYNLLIMEDDPYYYLQFNKRVPSLFSMDVDARVLRFDSFSKVLSSGLRLGFATGPTVLIEKLCMDTQATCLHPSGLSQAVALKLLQHWQVCSSAFPSRPLFFLLSFPFLFPNAYTPTHQSLFFFF